MKQRIIFLLWLFCFSLTAYTREEVESLKQHVNNWLPMMHGWCTSEKASAMIDLILETKPEVCVEIGVFGGSSFFPIVSALKFLNHGIAVGIDPWDRIECIKNIEATDPNSKAHLEWWGNLNIEHVYYHYLNVFRSNDLGSHSITMVSTSEKAAPAIGTIDFLNIDGNNSAEAAAQDVALYLPKVRLGGHLCMNDMHLGKKKAVDMVLQACDPVRVMDNGNSVIFKKRAPFPPPKEMDAKELTPLETKQDSKAVTLDLKDYEKSIYSQNGEDGVIAKIFQLIKPKTRYYVDCGANDGVTGSNTCLLRKQGWSGLMLDRLYEVPELGIHKEIITAENIENLFAKYKVPEEFDLLSIDIDYNDFYIWNALKKYKPKVVVIEYNAILPPTEDKIVKYSPYYYGKGDHYFGASILAMYRLGRSKGYSLVHAEESGTNLFFVRDDLLESGTISFANINNVDNLYRKPKYASSLNGVQRENPNNEQYVSTAEVLQ